jgi:hypothetical protein
VQVHYGEGVANHTDPESCAAYREVCGGEALTRERAGQPLSHEIFLIQGADVVTYAEGKNDRVRQRECPNGPAWSETLACTDALCLGTGRSPVWPFAVKCGPCREGEEP